MVEFFKRVSCKLAFRSVSDRPLLQISCTNMDKKMDGIIHMKRVLPLKPPTTFC